MRLLHHHSPSVPGRECKASGYGYRWFDSFAKYMCLCGQASSGSLRPCLVLSSEVWTFNVCCSMFWDPAESQPKTPLSSTLLRLVYDRFFLFFISRNWREKVSSKISFIDILTDITMAYFPVSDKQQMCNINVMLKLVYFEDTLEGQHQKHKKN